MTTVLIFRASSAPRPTQKVPMLVQELQGIDPVTKIEEIKKLNRHIDRYVLVIKKERVEDLLCVGGARGE